MTLRFSGTMKKGQFNHIRSKTYVAINSNKTTNKITPGVEIQMFKALKRLKYNDSLNGIFLILKYQIRGSFFPWHEADNTNRLFV